MKRLVFALTAALAVGMLAGKTLPTLTTTVLADGKNGSGDMENAAPIVVDGTVVDTHVALEVNDVGDSVAMTHMFINVKRVVRGGTSDVAALRTIDVMIPGGTLSDGTTMVASHHPYIPVTGDKVHILLQTSNIPGIYVVFGGEFAAQRIG